MDDQIVDVAIVGGGIIGLSIAWRLAQRGRSVTIIEKGEVGREASRAAAGMLSPAAEIGFEELVLYRFEIESLRRWPGFARDLKKACGYSVGYRDEGTLIVATDRDDAEVLRRHYRFQKEQGASVEWLAGFEALEIEPMLAPGLPAAVFCRDDHQVANRVVLRALSQVIHESKAVMVLENRKVRAVNQGEAGAVVVLDDGAQVKARVAVLAAGAWSRDIGGIEPRLPVRPVKGQVLSLQMKAPFELKHVVRGLDAYLVPKPSGRLVVGATSEEKGFDTEVTAGGVYRLLEAAVEIVPGIEELELIETTVGHRPASRDHAPLIGWITPNVFAATGHFRLGILLAPVTADEVAIEIDTMLNDGAETSEWLAPFSPDRF